jgi:plastocyanin
MATKLWGVAAAALALSTLPAAAETISVNVDKLSYTPAEVSAHVGDTIEWVNGDFLAHTATARNKEWDVMIMRNKTGRITLKHGGNLEYYCRFHPNMTGRISVAE